MELLKIKSTFIVNWLASQKKVKCLNVQTYENLTNKICYPFIYYKFIYYILTYQLWEKKRSHSLFIYEIMIREREDNWNNRPVNFDNVRSFFPSFFLALWWELLPFRRFPLLSTSLRSVPLKIFIYLNFINQIYTCK